MNVFLKLATLKEQLQKMINSFWWGNNKRSSKGMNWLNWDKLTMKKEFGGLGFWHLHGFYQQRCYCNKALQSKIFSKGKLLGCPFRHNPSYVWRNIHASQVLVKNEIKWRLGNGQMVNVWTQPWIWHVQNLHDSTSPPYGWENLNVISFINHEKATWKIKIIDKLFNRKDKLVILWTPLLNTTSNDELIWHFSKHENYTMRTTYHHLMDSMLQNDHLKVEGN